MTPGGHPRLSSRTGVATTHSITRQIMQRAAEAKVGGGLGIIGCPATCVHAALGVAIGAHSAPWLGTAIPAYGGWYGSGYVTAAADQPSCGN